MDPHKKRKLATITLLLLAIFFGLFICSRPLAIGPLNENPHQTRSGRRDFTTFNSLETPVLVHNGTSINYTHVSGITGENDESPFQSFLLSRQSGRGGTTPAPNPLFQECLCKGETMLQLLASDDPLSIDPRAVQSPWLDYANLEQQGWKNREYFQTPSLLEINDMFETLGLPVDRMDWRGESVDTYRTDNPAYYQCSYLPKDGMIVAIAIFGPDYFRDLAGARMPIPVMKQWSDVAFLEYQNEARNSGTSPNYIRWVVQHGVINDITTHVITSSLQNMGATIGSWANRVTLTMDTNEGKAVLGTPNGLGTAWLLLQHRAAFGKKTVTKIDIFSHEWFPGGAPDMLLWIEDVQSIEPEAGDGATTPTPGNPNPAGPANSPVKKDLSMSGRFVGRGKSEQLSKL